MIKTLGSITKQNQMCHHIIQTASVIESNRDVYLACTSGPAFAGQVTCEVYSRMIYVHGLSEYLCKYIMFIDTIYASTMTCNGTVVLCLNTGVLPSDVGRARKVHCSSSFWCRT